MVLVWKELSLKKKKAYKVMVKRIERPKGVWGKPSIDTSFIESIKKYKSASELGFSPKFY